MTAAPTSEGRSIPLARESAGLAAYVRVLRRPHARRLVSTALIGRLPGGMVTLSILLLVRDTTGSYGVAGAVAGANGVASALGQPLQGRLIDRVGQPRVLLPASAVFAISFPALALASHPAVLVALGIVSGLAFPALASGLRVLWPDLIDGDEGLQTAYALDAAVQQLMLVGGPLIVAVVAAAGPPWLLAVVAAALALLGTAAFATTPVSREWRGRLVATHYAGPLRASAIRVLVLATVLGGITFGWLVVTATAFAEAEGSAAASGLMIACWSAGGVTAGLLYGARTWPGPAHARYVSLAVLLAVATAAPALAGSLPAMALAMLIAGCAFGPWQATSFLLVDLHAPAGTATEAFAWMVTGVNAGVAAGAALAGPLIEGRGIDAALVTAPVGAAAGAALLAFGGRALRAR